MRLPVSSSLRRRLRLPHPVRRRAPTAGTVGLRNPASRPVRVRGNRFWGALRRLTGSTASSSDDEFLHTDNFFPDLSDFFDNLNMGDNDAAAKQINSSSVAAATRPPLFDGMHYKRWRTKAVLWFTNLGCFSATDARPEGPLSAEEQEKFEKVDAMFKAALFSILGDNIVDPYIAFDHEKARAKDTRARSFEGGSSANVVQKKNFQSHKSKNKNNGKGKFDEKNKASNSTNFKRKTPYKKKGNCHVCGAPGHWAPDCPERHDRRGNSGKSANVVIGVDTEMKDVGYGFLLLWETAHVLPVRGVEHFDNPVEDDNEAPKRSKRQRTAKSFGHDFIVYLVDDTPTSISEAYASQDADYWKEAVRSEMDSILANGTWEVTDRPYGCKPVFGERSGATTRSTTSSSDDEFLHTDNFFPDLSDFFDNLNMGDNDAAAKHIKDGHARELHDGARAGVRTTATNSSRGRSLEAELGATGTHTSRSIGGDEDE
ncbi:hypothetical protein QYE76_023583 [Lolium multiflorum]|uniref:CCHC-type domain-containing protein n=1 Tax=Lolium multiflorum TaxID=4521 RepID=A0AAD8VU92_LOLMU|nr:hypothetical protein QYE76_023583 [Lolium multiflorum]